MATEQGDNPDENAPKSTTTFNVDAPEFNPNPTRSSGTLNADAPEFIPGKLGTYDGGLGYVSVSDMKHGKRYNRGAYQRPSQMHQAGMQYHPRWSPQYVPMWVPYSVEMDRSGAVYDYSPYHYGQRRGYDGHPRHNRFSKHPSADGEPPKREPRTPHGMSMHGNAETYSKYSDSQGVETTHVDSVSVGPSTEDGPVKDATSTPKKMTLQNSKDNQSTWADKFRQTNAEQGEPDVVKTEEPTQPAPSWNGRPTFAEMMKKAVGRDRKLQETPPELPVQPVVDNAEPVNERLEEVTPTDTCVAKDNKSPVNVPPQVVDVSVENKTVTEEASEPVQDPISETAEVSMLAMDLDKCHINQEPPVEDYTTTPKHKEAETTDVETETFQNQEPIVKPEDDGELENREIPIQETKVEPIAEAVLEDETEYQEVEEPSEVVDKDSCLISATDDSVDDDVAETNEGTKMIYDGQYTVDKLLACGFELKKHYMEEKLRWGFMGPGRESKGSDHRRGVTYDDRTNNSRYKGENWPTQRRSARYDVKSFGSSNKGVEFSRDQLEAVSIPRASESSWIIKQAKLKMDKEQQLIRKLMGLLNRLTVEKFDTIYKQVLSSGVETYNQAFVLVKIIFEKAITQHHFIPMYVELCAKLSYDLNNFTDNEDASVAQGDSSTTGKSDQKATRRSDFMKILLNCCQDSFENNLKPMECPPDLEGDDKFEFELKYKHRMRGNMIFVGELFKQKLLAAKLLITCLSEVFAKRNECIAATGRIETGDNHLEGMCTLLQTVGKCFDTDKWKYSGEFEKYIQMLTDLGRNPNICFRIRCLIQNVLDSRHGNWTTSTPYKPEGPCRLQELRTKVMEQEKQQEENAWRLKKRGKNLEIKTPSSKPSPAPNVLANPIVIEPLSSEEIKRRTRGIVKELVMSHDAAEASLCISELNLAQGQDVELFCHIFNAALESCAKITAENERHIVAKWMVDLAIGRLSQESLVKWMKGFVTDETPEHGYSMMIEDYPVVPLMLKELLVCMKERYSNVSGFDEVSKIIENDIYPNAAMIN